MAAPHVISMELGLSEEGGDVVIVKSILDLVVLATNCPDQSPISEQAKLVRDG